MAPAWESGPHPQAASAAAKINARMVTVQGTAKWRLPLERKIFDGLMEHAGAGHVTVRVDRRATQSHLVVQVRRGDAARAAYHAHDFTPPHLLPDVNADAGKV